jgi:hypothetical protein
VTRAAAKAAATADALLAWLDTQTTGGATAAAVERGAGTEETASAHDWDGADGVPGSCGADTPATPPVADEDTRPPRLAEHTKAERRAAPMRLPHTDWLHHRLAIVGPTEQIASFRRAAAGAGVIPWQLDLDRMEEDVFHLLVAPPAPQRRTLSVAGARVLAGQLREAVRRRHDRAVAGVVASQVCPFDLHALIPVPDEMLRLGPDDPAALAWLWEHWGTTQPLRHVAEEASGSQELRRRSVPAGQNAIHLAFWSADWTPWRALAALARRRRPGLCFDVRPTYDGS